MPDVEERLHQAAEPLRDGGLFDAAAVADRMVKLLGLAQGPGTGGARCQAYSPALGGLRTASPLHTPPDDQFRDELANLVEKEVAELTARQLRRVAELTELLDGEDASLPWWRRAARAGDDLAAATLEEIDPE